MTNEQMLQKLKGIRNRIDDPDWLINEVEVTALDQAITALSQPPRTTPEGENVGRTPEWRENAFAGRPVVEHELQAAFRVGFSAGLACDCHDDKQWQCGEDTFAVFLKQWKASPQVASSCQHTSRTVSNDSQRCNYCGYEWGETQASPAEAPASPSSPSVPSEKWQRLYNLVCQLAHPHGDHNENECEDEAHDLIRELRAERPGGANEAQQIHVLELKVLMADRVIGMKNEQLTAAESRLREQDAEIEKLKGVRDAV